MKKFTDSSDFFKAGIAMREYQKIHLIIRKDFTELLNITEKHKDVKTEFDSLYRACLKGFFSIVEADIFGLNNIEKYKNYSDRDDFETKFKMTFKQVGKTWNKVEIQKKYFDAKYFDLKTLKIKRDELIHPKKQVHLHESNEIGFEKIKEVFYDYVSFIDELMKDFYISVNISTKNFWD